MKKLIIVTLALALSGCAAVNKALTSTDGAVRDGYSTAQNVVKTLEGYRSSHNQNTVDQLIAILQNNQALTQAQYDALIAVLQSSTTSAQDFIAQVKSIVETLE